ncbi:nudix hydrolase 15, mitochondrial-like [Elaeis guineensis]|uniref:Nudix hydrolase 15, mitochondrial n=1 Tax=Elaeis guineensis var. tenera TaxID=51953 RepID=A0A6I9RCP9_ELAGV|nr:nudix hydrolase 15, mitochondrial [Elaeis guineensis]
MAAAMKAEADPVRDPMTSGPRLDDLVHRLRLYVPPSFPDEVEEDEVGDCVGDGMDERGKVVSQTGLADSAAVVPRLERFRPKRAAVLVCLFEGELGDLRVILTKRSSKLSTHSGEVSLPGGKADEGDADDQETALREAKEEIGLDPSLITVVTVLEPFLSRHLLRVVPVVGILSDNQAFKPVANADEVEAIFDAPLEMFLKDENRRSEEREWMGEKFLVHYFNFSTENKNFVIWGLTATMLIHAASIIYQRPPSFPEQKPRYRVPRYIKGTCIMP